MQHNIGFVESDQGLLNPTQIARVTRARQDGKYCYICHLVDGSRTKCEPSQAMLYGSTTLQAEPRRWELVDVSFDDDMVADHYRAEVIAFTGEPGALEPITLAPGVCASQYRVLVDTQAPEHARACEWPCDWLEFRNYGDIVADFRAREHDRRNRLKAV